MSLSAVDLFLHCAPLQVLLEECPKDGTKTLFLQFYVRIVYGALGIFSQPEDVHWLALCLGIFYTVLASFVFSKWDSLEHLTWVLPMIAVSKASNEALELLRPLTSSLVLSAGLAGMPRAYLTGDAQSMGPVLLHLACVVKALMDEIDSPSAETGAAAHANLVLAVVCIGYRIIIHVDASENAHKRCTRDFKRNSCKNDANGHHEHRHAHIAYRDRRDSSERSSSRGRSLTRREIICARESKKRSRADSDTSRKLSLLSS